MIMSTQVSVSQLINHLKSFSSHGMPLTNIIFLLSLMQWRRRLVLPHLSLRNPFDERPLSKFALLPPKQVIACPLPHLFSLLCQVDFALLHPYLLVDLVLVGAIICLLLFYLFYL